MQPHSGPSCVGAFDGPHVRPILGDLTELGPGTTSENVIGMRVPIAISLTREAFDRR
jgi:hypothetical protein